MSNDELNMDDLTPTSDESSNVEVSQVAPTVTASKPILNDTYQNEKVVDDGLGGEDVERHDEDVAGGEYTDVDIATKFLSIFGGDFKEITEALNQISPNQKVSSAEKNKWREAFRGALNHIYEGRSFEDIDQREGSDWNQQVSYNGGNIGVAVPKVTSKDGVLAGDQAVAAFEQKMDIGRPVHVPLWHTGIWLTLSPPDMGQLITLEETMAKSKVELGRDTHGMVYSNTSVYTTSHLMDLVFDCVKGGSLKDLSADNLRRVIKSTDIPILIWGLANTIYPNGYRYARPCTSSNDCNHVVQAVLDFGKIFWTDNSALSEAQRKHMSDRKGKFTPEQIKAYQDAHSRGTERTIPISESKGINFVFSVPTIAEYEKTGQRWVDEIVNMTTGSLSDSESIRRRNESINRKAKATNIAQYSHWVKEIQLGDDLVEERESVEAIIRSYSKKEGADAYFFKEIYKYINDATISFIAIPKYKCPMCQGEQEQDVHNVEHPHLLALDAMSAFFTLLGQSLYQTETTKSL